MRTWYSCTKINGRRSPGSSQYDNRTYQRDLDGLREGVLIGHATIHNVAAFTGHGIAARLDALSAPHRDVGTNL